MLDSTFKFRTLSKKGRGPRDGDGDGFVLDGKPGMRPVTGADIKGMFDQLDNEPAPIEFNSTDSLDDIDRKLAETKERADRIAAKKLQRKQAKAQARAREKSGVAEAEVRAALDHARETRAQREAEEAARQVAGPQPETQPAWHGDRSRMVDSGPRLLDDWEEDELAVIWRREGYGDPTPSEPYPPAQITQEQDEAATVIGESWISGNWTDLRDWARKMRMDGRINEIADEDEVTWEVGVARTLTAVHDSPKSNVFRGLAVTEEVMERLTTPGYEFEEPLATATGNRSLAKLFSADRFGTSVADKDGRAGAWPVVLDMQVKNLPIHPPEDPWETSPTEVFLLGSDERLISGKYRVVSSEWMANERPAYYRVEVEQIGD